MMIGYAVLCNILVFTVFQAFGMKIQFSRILDQTNRGIIHSGVDFSAAISSPIPIYLLQFFTLVAALTILFIVAQSHFSIFFSQKVKHYIDNPRVSIALWALIANSALLIANAAWFPHTLHLRDIFHLWPGKHLNTYWCVAIVCLPIGFYLASNFLKRHIYIPTLIFVALLILHHLTGNNNEELEGSFDSNKPHVILIGVDSLRNDLLVSHMPYFTSLLKESTVFENALTPLGRTFPAWNSILTGQYPINHGARINLISPDQLAPRQNYLGAILEREGYRSIFSIDETRFANFNERHGFSHIISPRTGASDFIIGTFHDYPLINLLSTLPISSWLAPEVFANRAMATTYRSEAFSQLLSRELPVADEPTFLAVHFCLAHWPYYFASQKKPNWDYPEPYYPVNLQAVDEQIKALFGDLESKGYLKNARIVFLSDHGEAWVSESPIFTNKNESDSINKIHNPTVYGHGSTLTSDNNRVLIALKGFQHPNKEKNIRTITSLADISPTILNELDLPVPTHMDGSSLFDDKLTNDRSFPIETGTILSLDDDKTLDVNKVVRNLLDRYRLNESGLITVRNEKLDVALDNKLIGVFKNNMILGQFEKSQFRLFDIESKKFEHFDSLKKLKVTYPEWSNEWCYWYAQSTSECKERHNIDHK